MVNRNLLDALKGVSPNFVKNHAKYEYEGPKKTIGPEPRGLNTLQNPSHHSPIQAVGKQSLY